MATKTKTKTKTLSVMPVLPSVGRLADDWKATKLLHQNSQWWASQCVDAVIFNDTERFSKLLGIVSRAPLSWGVPWAEFVSLDNFPRLRNIVNAEDYSRYRNEVDRADGVEELKTVLQNEERAQIDNARKQSLPLAAWLIGLAPPEMFRAALGARAISMYSLEKELTRAFSHVFENSHGGSAIDFCLMSGCYDNLTVLQQELNIDPRDIVYEAARLSNVDVLRCFLEDESFCTGRSFSPEKLLKSLQSAWINGWTDNNYAFHWISLESPEDLIVGTYKVFVKFANTHNIKMPPIQKSDLQSFSSGFNGQRGLELSKSDAGKFVRLFIEEMGWVERPKNENKLSSIIEPRLFPFLKPEDKENMLPQSAKIHELRLRVASGASTIERQIIKI